jgi:hypothetical protein
MTIEYRLPEEYEDDYTYDPYDDESYDEWLDDGDYDPIYDER